MRLDESGPVLPYWTRVVVVALLLPVGFALLWAVVTVPASPGPVQKQVAERLAESGVSNPVTAVLLNFRAYDTLLEIAVLLLALSGVWAVGRVHHPLPPIRAGYMLESMTRVLLPLLVLVAGYLLWVGSKRPGGAFQAGSVLAAALLLLLFSGQMWERLASWNLSVWRKLTALGLTVFLLVALAMIGSGRNLLEYTSASAGGWILLIEAALTISIAAMLAGLFLGGEPPPVLRNRPGGRWNGTREP